jgi:DNA mismatch repair protein MSH3
MTDDPVVPGTAAPPTNALVALVEIGMGGMALDERVRIGLVSVVPETGDVVWDEFDGGSPDGWSDGRFASPHRARD